MTIPSDIVVRHNRAESCYETVVAGHRCVVDYVLEGDRMIFMHTLVPTELRGLGLAEKIVRVALADARVNGVKVVPTCSYVAKFIERHAEYQDLRA